MESCDQMHPRCYTYFQHFEMHLQCFRWQKHFPE